MRMTGLALALFLMAALLPATAYAADALSTDTSALGADANSSSAATVYYGGDA